MTKDALLSLAARLNQFARERDWEKFHSPKNISMALNVEAGELMEHFQWLNESDSYLLDTPKKLDVSLELADIFLYLIRIADILEIDLIDSAEQKLVINEKKYPVALSKGNAKKYTEFS